jgi:MFS family permease
MTGVFNLIISFMTNRYAFWILRALSGVFAVQTIPSAINMLVQMYPDQNVSFQTRTCLALRISLLISRVCDFKEQAGKLALFGLAGALANVLGLVLAGLFLLVRSRSLHGGSPEPTT